MKKRKEKEKEKEMVEHRHYDNCGDPDCCVYQVKCNDPDCDMERVDEKDYYDYDFEQMHPIEREAYSQAALYFQRYEPIELNWDDTPPRTDVIDVRKELSAPMNWDITPPYFGSFESYRLLNDSKKKMSAIRVQRMYLRHYTRRKVAARKISRAAHNWVWKPKCKDGTMGIRPRLDTLALGI